MTTSKKAKPNEITKREVFEAWKRVRTNGGTAGIDNESLVKFEAKLSRNLYKLWNRMSSGSYFPQAVKRVEIPKKDGSSRPLGIPTVNDRVAQEVVRARLEKLLEPHFHEDSYGYRPKKSAIDAIRVCRRRNWKYDWVLDLDIQKFFDTIDHELLMKAVCKHVREGWVRLYIERWLKAPVQHADGKQESNERGTPQGGVVSPVLANLYLHYAFDVWISRKYPSVKFERYADDAIIHCRSEAETKELKTRLEERFAECGLKLHPGKTKIVYCKSTRRKLEYENISYTFLGYCFRPRSAKNRHTGEKFTNFLPAVSREAEKNFREKLRKRNLNQHIYKSVDEIAMILNPQVRGWFGYFRHFYPSELVRNGYYLDCYLRKWVQKKYKKNRHAATAWLAHLKRRDPKLFAHWQILNNSSNG